MSQDHHSAPDLHAPGALQFTHTWPGHSEPVLWEEPIGVPGIPVQKAATKLTAVRANRKPTNTATSVSQ